MEYSREKHVTGERLWMGEHRYDLSVYRVEGGCFAHWFCEYCPNSGKTSVVGDPEAAFQAGLTTVRAHHAEHHAGD